MKFGYFDDDKREYVITTPRTPLPWINYLGSDDFFTLISGTGGGYSFYRDARLRRLTRYRYNNNPLDQEGFRLYIKDGDTIWNPGWLPVKTELDTYNCRHGLGYTILNSSKNQIEASQLLFVPRGENALLNQITLTNHSDKQRNLELFSYIEWCLWDANDDSTNFQRNYSIGEVEVKGSAIYHKTEYRERRDHYAVFWCDQELAGFDTSREAFCGPYGGVSMPEAVQNGSCSNSLAHGWQPIGAHQVHITLEPGCSRTVLFGLGYIENERETKWEAPNVINKEKAEALMSRFSNADQTAAALDALRSYWTELLSHLQVDSADEKMNRMVNIWNQYQCMVTFNMSRSASYYESGMGRGMGFRDSCQDLLGFVHIIPERARERILDIAATQFEDGSAYHQYQPLTKRGNLAVGSGFNDDPLWLIAGVDAYLRETGDYSILDEMVPFDNDETLAAPLLEHLRRSFRYTAEHLGPHQLPLIGRADWNDCLNLNCFSDQPGESFQTFGPSEGPVAESVFIAGMFCKYGPAWSQILKKKGLEEEAKEADTLVKQMEAAVLDAGWDGEWFIRAYDAFSEPIGSKVCSEGKIFIEPQGMCVMAGIGKETGEAAKALESVEKHLDTRYGVMLQQPAYQTYHLNLGEISSYPPGYKENAGIFCHNNPWITVAETVLGHGNRAFELYRKICPAYLEEISEIHRTEPYVYSQMIAGADAPTHGEAKNSWLTGTAAWTLLSISQAILGIQPTLDGLSINPCLPEDIKEFRAERLYRGALYKIHVDHAAGNQFGITSFRVNGEEITGTVIPVFPAGSQVQVEVVMG